MTIVNFQKTANKKSEGSVLIVAIMMLVILTLIGIAATTTSDIESQISTNDLFSKKAFYAAESGLNVTVEDLAQCVNDVLAYPASAHIGYLQGDGSTGGTADEFRKEAVAQSVYDSAKDIRVEIGDIQAEIDVHYSGVTVEPGGGSEFPGNELAAPSSTFVYFDLDSQGMAHRGAEYHIQAGSRILVSN